MYHLLPVLIFETKTLYLRQVELADAYTFFCISSVDVKFDRVCWAPKRLYSFYFSAMSEHPTTSWQAMQNGTVFYRRQQLYSILGKLPDLGDYIIAGCRYGGPLGTLTSVSFTH